MIVVALPSQKPKRRGSFLPDLKILCNGKCPFGKKLKLFTDEAAPRREAVTSRDAFSTPASPSSLGALGIERAIFGSSLSVDSGPFTKQSADFGKSV
jgi:hypothetical protein